MTCWRLSSPISLLYSGWPFLICRGCTLLAPYPLWPGNQSEFMLHLSLLIVAAPRVRLCSKWDFLGQVKDSYVVLTVIPVGGLPDEISRSLPGPFRKAADKEDQSCTRQHPIFLWTVEERILIGCQRPQPQFFFFLSNKSPLMGFWCLLHWWGLSSRWMVVR